ncbi:sirohydrochlorin chelatase [Saccharothrix sp. ST-888]|uniref:sirohydrochlorin chelatase n=1 Tax=Saccharothrix sp. ST-888 TaxID=1427391 RepID=UPI0005ECAD4E|nr:sirohydrochlorin chelatase [Saccharothrix sp. ST-888]KJK56364.1 sirohydrochlorin cobaltochelatase [Saccharothrix sp. ST-888]
MSMGVETPGPVLVLVAHGSRDPAALAEVRRLAGLVRAARPGLDVRLGCLGLSEPLLAQVLEQLSGPVVLVPLLLGRGYHVKVDIPAALAAAPQVDGVVTGALGPDPVLAEVLHERLAEAGWRAEEGSAVVLATAGSRDPDAAVDAERQARLLAARLGAPVRPGGLTCGSGVAGTVAALAAEGYQRVAVASYFTAPGDFARQACAAPGAWLAAEPLGAHPAMARLILARYASALTHPLPLAA